MVRGFIRFAAILLALAPLAAQRPAYRETVDVTRLLIDARVLDRNGAAMLDLQPADFAVKIDGKPGRVESVQWLGGVDPDLEATEFRPGIDTSRGRLVVFLIQKDFERGRITGLMQAMTEAPAFLAAFTPDDRLAVLSFDSQLKIWLDFTNDVDEVRRVLQRGVIAGRPRPLNHASPVSLVDRLDRLRAGRTYSIEKALEVIAEALAPLPGSKSVVLVGYGFGRLSFGRVLLDTRYDRARNALQNARASVFCLDVTPADYHSLEAGLQEVAEDTGGFFTRTHIFTRNAFDRVAAALQGHYVLFVEKPTLRRGAHRIDVKLARRDGSIFAKNAYVD